jgi:hypothetical protein
VTPNLTLNLGVRWEIYSRDGQWPRAGRLRRFDHGQYPCCRRRTIRHGDERQEGL